MFGLQKLLGGSFPTTNKPPAPQPPPITPVIPQFNYQTPDQQIPITGSTADLRHEPTIFNGGNTHFNNAPYAAYSESLYNNSGPPVPLLQVQPQAIPPRFRYPITAQPAYLNPAIQNMYRTLI